MRKNPFAQENDIVEVLDNEGVDLQKNAENAPVVESENLDLEISETEPQNNLLDDLFAKPTADRYEYVPETKKLRSNVRDVTKELTDEEYHIRLAELNNNAENKHYVLFFGQPASGKTWIIGSLLHYMKNFLGGTVYLDTTKTTDTEEELFYHLQDRFNNVIHTEKITSTDKTQYFELHISFTPKDSDKPPMNIVFIDASGEHSEQGFRTRNDEKSGQLPNYLTAILESNVNTKLAFVYDQSLVDEKGGIPQMNVLNAVFTHIQHIQNNHGKKFSKALLLSKADRIFATDMAAVERNRYDPMYYALEKIPSFANSFFNESENNKTIFYKMGIFSVNSDLILEFDKECPEKLFRWLYMEGTGGTSPITEPTCWDKLKSWFKGA
ncbi:ribonucleoside-triphosphate reductase [Pasteurellaceae bacterium LFhippo2]|nr:ribonucleoside-triphosphate reductase [Pasteurellaceae bacterium LFhippo2]